MLNIQDIHSSEFKSFIQDKETPFYLFDPEKVRFNYKRFKDFFPNFKIFYSTKTNPCDFVLKVINEEGGYFDAATLGEIKQIISLGVEPSKILFTHPIKSQSTIKEALNLGIKKFTIDSIEEIIVFKDNGIDTELYLRILPPVKGNFYDYQHKFGASKKDIDNIFNYALSNGIKIYGLSFHVGSQNTSLGPWDSALKLSKEIFASYYSLMPTLRVINVGSGFPGKYNFDYVPTLDVLSKYIHNLISRFPDDVQFWAEPGRIIVADSAVLVCTVIKSIRRERSNWLFVDTSVYSGLIEVLESGGKLNYRIETYKNGPLKKYNISGNTLDPDDTLAFNVHLPSDLKEGDKVVVFDVGAYTTSFFTTYHSYHHPSILLTKPIV